MPSDPYKYFRIEARELHDGLSQGVLQLEKGSSGKETIALILRLAHTLKGAARVMRQPEIAEHAHQIEEALAECRAGDAPVSRSRIDELLGHLDALSIGIAALEPVLQARAADPRTSGSDRFESARVEVSEVDAVLAGVSEMRTRLAALRRELERIERGERLARMMLERLDRSRGASAGAGPGPDAHLLAEDLHETLKSVRRDLGMATEHAERECAQLGEKTSRLRLAPASVALATLERTARDAAGAMNKQVRLELKGGGCRMDGHVLSSLQAALVQVVRNAIAHGIESPAERRAAGKPPVGLVRIEVVLSGDRATFTCGDDGRGIDVEAVRDAAVGRRLVSAQRAAELGLEDIIELLLAGGVSTTTVATEVSGRGVGLDVVRETVAGLKGTVRVRSQPGIGTTVEIGVPVTISAISALIAESDDRVIAIPVDHVRQTLRLSGDELVRSADGFYLLHEEKTIPFLPLAAALEDRAPVDPHRTWSIVCIQAGARAAAFGVDRFMGIASIVVRRLPELAAAQPVVAGAYIDADGDPQLVIDPVALLEALDSVSTSTALEPTPPRPSILVVDDSLTTRMLEQSILESAGYPVEVATSGEEALGKASSRPYGLMVVDVEMPGMDGFELIHRTRQDPALRQIPAILVTSRNSNEDRRRGEEVGACAYMVKSEFDQERLLATIRELIG